MNKTNSCWLWTGGVSLGYGRFKAKSGQWLAHRFAWFFLKGSIPSGMCVLHDCPGGDNPRCVNPAHLWLGTRDDNNKDAVVKGQTPTGDKHWSRRLPDRVPRGSYKRGTKLTEKDIPVIRRRLKRGDSFSQIAKDYNVCSATISHVKTGRDWKHC